jgi:hypothetical protein
MDVPCEMGLPWRVDSTGVVRNRPSALPVTPRWPPENAAKSPSNRVMAGGGVPARRSSDAGRPPDCPLDFPVALSLRGDPGGGETQTSGSRGHTTPERGGDDPRARARDRDRDRDQPSRPRRAMNGRWPAFSVGDEHRRKPAGPSVAACRSTLGPCRSTSTAPAWRMARRSDALMPPCVVYETRVPTPPNGARRRLSDGSYDRVNLLGLSSVRGTAERSRRCSRPDWDAPI